jgi:hypothetical protein
MESDTLILLVKLSWAHFTTLSGVNCHSLRQVSCLLAQKFHFVFFNFIFSTEHQNFGVLYLPYVSVVDIREYVYWRKIS